jgi:hypothetical protein
MVASPEIVQFDTAGRIGAVPGSRSGPDARKSRAARSVVRGVLLPAVPGPPRGRPLQAGACGDFTNGCS